ncbi:MAG: D-alanine--D-alanine ligase [Eggerthellaceae bacterium]|nr:D-alanine--D-alanine ligase [Eggerthellaceae bacterium]
MFNSFDPHTCKVALLAGGTSGEREVSLASGEGARAALLEAGYSVEVFDPAKKEDLKSLIDGGFDVAFLCLHGRGGEDGVIQGFLELIELPYIGSGVWSSALAIDKVQAKRFYIDADIPTPTSLSLKKDDAYSIDEIIEKIGVDCVIKPSTEGSSLGVFIAHSKEDIEKALLDVFKYDTHALIERYITGTELTVAVLGNEDPFALPIIEIIPKSSSYDFDSKYAPGGSEHICPARLSDTVAREIQDLAVRAHKALGCSGVSRSDFILDEEGVSWILETNTIPGMTGTSLLPDAARAAGISFPELCTKLIKFALEEK